MGSLWLSILLAAFLYTALTLLQLLLRRVKVLQRINISLNVLFLLFSIYIFLNEPLGGLHPNLCSGVEAALFCFFAYIAIRMFDVWFFDVIIQRRLKRPMPVVVRDIARWIVLAIAFFLILRAIFPDLNLNILAVSSIVVGYIVGNATQDTLGNLIAGLALNTESPFSIGDWVMVGGHTGCVVEMTWRATRLCTKTNDHIVIPNATIAREPIVNYSRPTVRHGFTVEIGVSYEVPPNTMRRVIHEVLGNVPSILKEPSPRVWLTRYNDFSIDYTIKFYITDFERLEDIQSQVMYLVWYHFKREDITIPFPIRDVRMAPDAPKAGIGEDELSHDEHLAVLRGIDLFRPLADNELSLVADNLSEEIYATGELIIRQGDEGDSIYIVTAGSVNVTLSVHGQKRQITTLGAGDFFGEISLLTGEKRNASVAAESDTSVLVLSHNVLAKVLKSNSKLADELAGELARRQKLHSELLAAGSITEQPAPQEAEPHSMLVTRIKRFFGLED